VATLGDGGAITEVTFAGSRWLAVAAPFPDARRAQGGQPGPAAKRPIRYLVLRSLDRALEAWRSVARALLAIATVALLSSLALASGLSRRLSRPLDALVRLTERLGAGDLEARAEVARPVELRALGDSLNRMAAELLESRRQLAEKARLQRELEIATRIQTSILPREVRVAGLEVAATMRPANEVGGDYYDVLPFEGGAWIGIGDVAGHGLTAGLVMMMIQSIVASLVDGNAIESPSEVLRVLNRTLYDNIRRRLGQDEHVTLTLLRYDAARGSMVHAGAHEEIIVCRGDGRCERIATPGTWLGAMPEVDRFMVDSRFELQGGDLVALYSDGLIQAMDRAGEQWGLERLCALLSVHRERPVTEIRDRVLDDVLRFTGAPARPLEDDVTLLLLRYRGVA
jgi:sigma-B regulation protein RsbU (phosphoserine phosphatase)